jgi:hypothetical protein
MPRIQNKKRVCGVITGSGPKGSMVAEELPSNVALVDRNVPISYIFPGENRGFRVEGL